jgi:hypothetical protein
MAFSNRVITAMSLTATKSRSPYEVLSSSSLVINEEWGDLQSAVFHLNALQSNASVIAQLRKQREIFPSRNIVDTERFLSQCAIHVQCRSLLFSTLLIRWMS